MIYRYLWNLCQCLNKVHCRMGEVMGQAGYWNFPNLFLQDLQVASYFAADFLWFSDKIVVQHLLDHDHAKSAKSRNIGQPQGGKKLLKQKSTWICSMKIPKSWGLRDHARVRRLIHRCLEERPGRYVPLESTWWGFRPFLDSSDILWLFGSGWMECQWINSFSGISVADCM